MRWAGLSAVTALRWLALLLLTWLALMPARAVAEIVTVTDVAGRQVSVTVPVRRVILGEGRQIHVTAALDRDDPFGRIVGWGEDFEKSDPDTYAAYVARFPQEAALPRFGSPGRGAFDIEKAISLQPDLVVLGAEMQRPAEEIRLVERLAALGIPVVYVDFRHAPSRNTEPSLRLLGQLFGKSEVAEALIAFRAAEIARVTERLAAAGPLAKPLVMLDRIPGYSDECCLTFGNENFGAMVAAAGGINLGSELLPGTFGTINPETIIVRDPDVVIVTGGNWEALAPSGAWVGLGPGADLRKAQEKLAALAARPAFRATKAVRAGRVHAIWHQFYTSPYQFVALQRIARWLHPGLFADLDPDDTLRRLHARFLPIAYRPGYWIDIER
ncbi:Iron complex transport system substrate-binding protein [Bosea sp. 62]|uniref:ABC transporter substrate-binding protein n=1 Tax=unclassified Bosea (in: a-proteobacteria) TaxID=2653178 RepID=UPI0012586CC0|nr:MULTISPECIES: ABC transporter substrate-binding protein [unclassified Bosea (in: a-proteobacteria)]CAD5251680.1 Iron complex transport system substrate-binding protein [Bosea sp. 7B]CAD5280158.1 Iron complex transport system substrate-binding protein [Bosea sp. 21B]CAD5281270.1 Iron complex transport system substrate-binding protein [Bosea sp. 46]VVT59461.1 Iron complex transport system substrate-binding protein [Bosea sp. EC-HK365B]VXB29847.1 Iron complex transport system substrate-binding